MIDKIVRQLEIPRRLRAVVRARESSLIALAALVGAIAGLVVAAMGTGVDLLHRLFFHLEPGVRLSGLLRLDPLVAISVPLVGGLVFGVARELIARWRPEREVDPIEANALHGGRMSLLGSMIVAAQTVWSSGIGASVGLEAGYTQFASGIASRIGMAFRLRRADLRILVGCGAAGAPAAADPGEGVRRPTPAAGPGRNRRMATTVPRTPQAASTARCRQSAPACRASGAVSASLNGRTGSQPAIRLSNTE